MSSPPNDTRFIHNKPEAHWPPEECEWCGTGSACYHDLETDFLVCSDCAITERPKGKATKKANKKKKRMVY